jgi:hypothetical protein
MRLFDHLAAGRPIVATAVNEQINGFAPPVHLGRDAAEICAQLEQLLMVGAAGWNAEAQREIAQQEVWEKRAQRILKTIQSEVRAEKRT